MCYFLAEAGAGEMLIHASTGSLICHIMLIYQGNLQLSYGSDAAEPAPSSGSLRSLSLWCADLML